MEAFKAVDGTLVTEKMIDAWEEALDRDEWPEGSYSVGPVIHGRPPLSSEGSAVISVKVPVGMKRAVEREAKNEGLSVSEFVRMLITRQMLETASTSA